MRNVIKAIQQYKSFLIVGHYHPDGDAIGSALALGMSLKKLKKRIAVYNRDDVPYNLKFLPGIRQLTNIFPAAKFDCAIMVDCAQPKRISKEFADAVESKTFKALICIDHHLLDAPVGDIDCIDPKAASTGCVIWSLLKKMRLNKSADIANLIYCTLTVDTGSFRYSNTTAAVFDLAAELLREGANPWLVARNLEENNPVVRYRLLGLSLKSLHIGFNGKFASMDVTREMLQTVEAHEDLSDEFANYPRSIAGVEVSALYREMKEGQIKISLRSKLKVDVSKITKQFGGGGHKHAAGCIIHADLPTAKLQIENAVGKAL